MWETNTEDKYETAEIKMSMCTKPISWLYNHITLNFHSKFYEEFVFYFAPLEIAIIFKEMQFKETWIIQLRVSWLYISLKTHLHAIYSM